MMNASIAQPAAQPAAQFTIQSAELPALINKARSLLDDNAVQAARELARQGYDQAKAAVSLGKRFKAADVLIERSRKLQGEALLIESQALMRIADDWDKAQETGANSAKGGRPKTVCNEDGFTAEDIGMTRQEIRQARLLRDREAKQPGIIEQAIAARVEQGLEPTRASIRGIGTRSASSEERGLDFYPTPAEAVHTLLALEQFSNTILEPCCGNGAISKLLEAEGYKVRLMDVVDRGCCDRFGELQQVGDFLEASRPEEHGVDTVTNPPFNTVNPFIAHAIREFRPSKMAMLLNLNAMCGVADANRTYWMEENPPARILVFARRLPMMHRDGYEGNRTGSQMNTAWFIWERGFRGHPELHRVDWKKYQPENKTAAANDTGRGADV